MRYLSKRKKVVIVILVVMMSIGLLNGCGNKGGAQKNKDGIYTNKEYSEKGMKKIDGSDLNYDNIIMRDGIGYGVDYTVFKDLNETCFLHVKNCNITEFTFYTEKGVEIENSTSQYLTEEEYGQLAKTLESQKFDYAAFLNITKDDKYADYELDYLQKNYKNVDKLTTLGEDTYYFAYNDDYSYMTLNVTEQKSMERIMKERDKFKSSIVVFPAVDFKKQDERNMNDFSAKTLDGQTFTQEDFKNYDLTMVNIWNTVCGSCIKEMPELEKVYEGLPKNVNMISICTDGDESNELAKNIMKVKGDKFKALISDSKLRKSLTDSIDAFPTTVFVDKEGNIVGTQVGVPDANNTVEGYNTLIDKYLKTAISDSGNNKEEVGSVGGK